MDVFNQYTTAVLIESDFVKLNKDMSKCLWDWSLRTFCMFSFWSIAIWICHDLALCILSHESLEDRIGNNAAHQISITRKIQIQVSWNLMHHQILWIMTKGVIMLFQVSKNAGENAIYSASWIFNIKIRSPIVK